MKDGAQALLDADRSRRARAGAREAGLALASRANRWMISGAVILAGGVSALTAHAFHARAAQAAGATAGTVRPATKPGHAGSSTPLQAPAQAPAAAPAAPAPAPAAVSGGS